MGGLTDILETVMNSAGVQPGGHQQAGALLQPLLGWVASQGLESVVGMLEQKDRRCAPGWAAARIFRLSTPSWSRGWERSRSNSWRSKLASRATVPVRGSQCCSRSSLIT